MTLRADLTTLLTHAGLVGVDIDKAAGDEHVRSSVYRKVIGAVAASRCRADDCAVVAMILRDPEELTAKTAVVEFVDSMAMKADDPADFPRPATW